MVTRSAKIQWGYLQFHFLSLRIKKDLNLVHVILKNNGEIPDVLVLSAELTNQNWLIFVLQDLPGKLSNQGTKRYAISKVSP